MRFARVCRAEDGFKEGHFFLFPYRGAHMDQAQGRFANTYTFREV